MIRIVKTRMLILEMAKPCQNSSRRRALGWLDIGPQTVHCSILHCSILCIILHCIIVSVLQQFAFHMLGQALGLKHFIARQHSAYCTSAVQAVQNSKQQTIHCKCSIARVIRVHCFALHCIALALHNMQCIYAWPDIGPQTVLPAIELWCTEYIMQEPSSR